MSIGAMRHKIEIQSMTVANDGGGGRAITLWKTDAYVHAQIVPKSGSEREFGDQIEASTKYEITIAKAANKIAHSKVTGIKDGAAKKGFPPIFIGYALVNTQT